MVYQHDTPITFFQYFNVIFNFKLFDLLSGLPNFRHWKKKWQQKSLYTVFIPFVRIYDNFLFIAAWLWNLFSTYHSTSSHFTRIKFVLVTLCQCKLYPSIFHILRNKFYAWNKPFHFAELGLPSTYTCHRN